MSHVYWTTNNQTKSAVTAHIYLKVKPSHKPVDFVHCFKWVQQYLKCKWQLFVLSYLKPGKVMTVFIKTRKYSTTENQLPLSTQSLSVWLLSPCMTTIILLVILCAISSHRIRDVNAVAWLVKCSNVLLSWMILTIQTAKRNLISFSSKKSHLKAPRCNQHIQSHSQAFQTNYDFPLWYCFLLFSLNHFSSGPIYMMVKKKIVRTLREDIYIHHNLSSQWNWPIAHNQY